MGNLWVECYAGYRGNQRPLRFALGERILEILEIEDQWYSPDAIYFRIRAEDGNFYVIRHDETEDRWSLEGYRAAR